MSVCEVAPVIINPKADMAYRLRWKHLYESRQEELVKLYAELELWKCRSANSTPRIKTC
jgi:hypothetical protein